MDTCGQQTDIALNWRSLAQRTLRSCGSCLGSSLKLGTNLLCKNLKGTLPQNLNSEMQILTDKLF